MNARIEAAARALYGHNEAVAAEAGSTLISPPADEYDCCAKAALEAADAVMFSDEAVERVKGALAEYQWYDATTDHEDPATGCTGCPDWFGSEDALDDGTFAAHQTAIVLAALRDAPHATGGGK